MAGKLIYMSLEVFLFEIEEVWDVAPVLIQSTL